jgi:hypothetical protein
MASQASVLPANSAFVPASNDDHRIEQPEMHNTAFGPFRARTPMSEDHWKQVGALLQKANEERLKVIYQEPLAGPPESMMPKSRNAQRTSRSVQDGLGALLRPDSRQ